MKRWLICIVGLMGFAAAGGAYAQCAGFTDMTDDGPPPTGQNCPAVQWLKNRAITGGTTPTTYSPGNVVNRETMALFLHRMGKKLTPEVQVRQGAFGPATLPGQLPASAALRCISDQTPAATYPRQVHVVASLSALADGNAAGIKAFLLVSTNSGATYVLFDPALPSVAQRGTAAANAWTNIALNEGMELAINTTYQFAIGVRRDDFGPVTTGDLAATRCQLSTTVANLNGTSPPYDAQ